MTTHAATKTLVPMNNPYFAKGYRLGRIWHFTYEWEKPLDDKYLIENIAHYCERGFHNDPEWLAERIGFIMGMVSGNTISEECELL